MNLNDELVATRSDTAISNFEEPLPGFLLSPDNTAVDDTGSYQLNLPLGSGGLYTLQVYASGFAPAIQTFDPSSAGGAVRMARAGECSYPPQLSAMIPAVHILIAVPSPLGKA